MTVTATSSQIHIRPSPGVWTARAGGAVIAQSERALELVEGGLEPAIYFPREDVALDLLAATGQTAGVAQKGTASLYAVVTPAGRIEAAVWSYDAPKQPLGAIARHLCFDPERVTLVRT